MCVIAHRLSTVQSADQASARARGGVGVWWVGGERVPRNRGSWLRCDFPCNLPPMCVCVCSCVQIIVLDGGQVVERGTHQELLRLQGGRYAALVNAQELTLQQTLQL